MKYEFHTHSPEQTEKIAADFANTIKDEKNVFIAMYGDLGAGKTAFVRGLASVITPGARVKSPTYTIVNEYKGEGVSLFHFDLYRISDDDELYSTGFYDYLSKGICIAEWSENTPWAIPKDAYKVKISKGVSEFDRDIVIEKD